MAQALRKKDLCESVISVMDRITPGRFRLRGMFLSELYGINLFLSKKSFDAGEMNRKEFIEKLDFARDILDEATEVSIIFNASMFQKNMKPVSDKKSYFTDFVLRAARYD